MEIGLVGMPRSGKTTLFNALTGSHADAFGEKAHVGVANIPDPRLDIIAGFITTRKVVPSTIRLVDIPGVPPESGAKKLNAFLEQIRQVDGICHVVRCFDDGSGTVDAAGDIERMDTELTLADLVVADSAKDRATRVARSGDADAKARIELLERVAPILEEGRAIRSESGWSDADRAMIRSYGFISAKQVLYVANVGEGDLGADPPHAAAVRAHAADTGGESVTVCAQLEAELAELEEPDRSEMLGSLGLDEPAIGPLARAANAALGLTTFYTAGDKEVRAWSVPLGATAPAAAGAIHTDIERGFIRAECYSVDQLQKYQDEKSIREAGLLRSEGKSYELQDGDVVHFLFNV
ncbi:MAG: redox-regulated ATPase YchF [Planctomycetes bacterium]|nr:redox-regulated ATPase YchF [Planctomycetota bacterium]